MAFDFGEQRIGVAFANRVIDSAIALQTLSADNTEAINQAIAALIKEWKPDTLVIGVPYNIDGTESRLSGLAADFGERLGKQYSLPVEHVDERLTSMEARMTLTEQRRTGQRRRRIRREDIDSLSAKLIAETWLHEN
ncbi:MAG: Holliday junction resolvase RuvX [Gammaproteobacteria bacterium]|nr:Holliday junction resolvase RuvX [Gammaproteobacteria bacterium]MDP7296843.1 Holliday junction resolvase RuvX [Gammaproteobacteria bacterium]MDP7419552.1 Holliday junction resolvase RuvX [Gammaproteobacteria bacterium]MDP7660037.1 Holliday junction resolvase RuvX [Gammaproteobacteria bacterium]